MFMSALVMQGLQCRRVCDMDKERVCCLHAI